MKIMQVIRPNRQAAGLNMQIFGWSIRFGVLLFVPLFFCFFSLCGKPVQPVKNLIVMIPDGTSIGVVSAARWYQLYNRHIEHLNLDPWLCGTVSTFCAAAPIGDSAPTTSCYMTGVPSQAGFVSTYPPVTGKEIIPLDSSMAYQPLATVLEAARILQNKATGLVVTCEFCHATPADCASHYYQRGNYKYIAPQMAYNDLDVMFGGGNNFITQDMKDYFKVNGTTLIQNDIRQFNGYSGSGKVWALFEKKEHPYDIDRDSSAIPSLEAMTRKALMQLSKNPNGFFLMVEGSTVDHAAHANDPVGCITEFLAFDKAVGAAIAFAIENGETAVVILPDHGNSGFTIGRSGCGKSSSTLEDLFGTVSQYKRTYKGIAEILKTTPADQITSVFKQYTGIDLSEQERKSLLLSKDYTQPSDYTLASEAKDMKAHVMTILNAKTCFGFTSGSHTGEEVFLAAYHPAGDVPLGFTTNVEINRYLCQALGFTTTLPELTAKIFAKHTDVLNGYSYSLDTKGEFPVLTVKKGKNTLVLRAFSSIAYLNKKPVSLGSVTVYVDRTDTFYLPSDILRRFQM
ncbi:MAG: alkaline phosphatase [Bacteroidales bacterium]|jgi:alkaline phosphatase|nr:alkaline phosphatase [Bacteroidales bacterium]